MAEQAGPESLCDLPDEQYADRKLFKSQYYQLVASARNLLPADKVGSHESASRSASMASYDNKKSDMSAKISKLKREYAKHLYPE